jgi:GNAT superfamily N-acetyltransferase
MVAVRVLDVHDDAELRAFWEVEQAAQRADRSHPVLWTWERRVQMLRAATPGPRRRVLLTAYDGPRLVGAAELSGSTRDNLHLAELEVHVLPSHRRRGIGGALHDEAVRRARADDRTTIIGEVTQPSAGQESAGVAFARSLGFTSAHREDHLVLDLPVPSEALPGPVPEDHAVLTWTNRAPDELVASYARMRTLMNRDVPIGELDLAPQEVTVDDVREEERRLGGTFDVVVGVAQRPDGELVGYTLLFLPRGEDYVQQDDTFVMRAARRRGLARALKLEALAHLHREHPERGSVHTWTAPDNEPMQRLNRGLGFRPVELMHEMQRRI